MEERKIESRVLRATTSLTFVQMMDDLLLPAGAWEIEADYSIESEYRWWTCLLVNEAIAADEDGAVVGDEAGIRTVRIARQSPFRVAIGWRVDGGTVSCDFVKLIATRVDERHWRA